MKRYFLLITAMLIIVSLFCSDKRAEINGSWKLIPNNTNIFTQGAAMGVGEIIEFKDNKCITHPMGTAAAYDVEEGKDCYYAGGMVFKKVKEDIIEIEIMGEKIQYQKIK